MVRNLVKFNNSILNIIMLIVAFSLSSCQKERLSSDVVLDENFQPTTTPFDLSSIENNQSSNNCFYKNNFVKVLISSPEIKVVNWKWFDGNSFLEIGNTPEITVTQNGNYKVYIKILDQDSVVDFELSYCPTSIEFPDVFTPNSNQFSKWRPVGIGVLRWDLQIFNNDNIEVYYSNSFLNTNWDGTYRGNPSPSGTYKYYIKGSYRSGEVFEKTGDFELVR